MIPRGPQTISRTFCCSFDLVLNTPFNFGHLLLYHSSPVLQSRRPSIPNLQRHDTLVSKWIPMQPISRSAMTRMQATCIILAQPSPGRFFFYKFAKTPPRNPNIFICLYAGCDATFDENLLDAFNAHVEAHFAESSHVTLDHNDPPVGAFDTAGMAEDKAVSPRGFHGQSIAQTVAPATNMTPNGNLGHAIPHTATHHINGVGRARSTCVTCNRTFSRRSDMERHAKKYQPAMRNYHCSVEGCEYSGSYRKDKLEAHVKNCHQEKVEA